MMYHESLNHGLEKKAFTISFKGCHDSYIADHNLYYGKYLFNNQARDNTAYIAKHSA
jgi:hypothetical protein